MIPQPQCVKRRCKHFVGVTPDDGKGEEQRPICKAFPKGIPDEIAYGNELHLQSFEGDHGIQYEPYDEEESSN